MNIFAKFGYKPLSRITNLGWQKAQTKSHSHLSPSPPRAPPNERALPPQAKELAEIQPLLYIGPMEMTEVPIH
jgi:hypothetical protein